MKLPNLFGLSDEQLAQINTWLMEREQAEPDDIRRNSVPELAEPDWRYAAQAALAQVAQDTPIQLVFACVGAPILIISLVAMILR